MTDSKPRPSSLTPASRRARGRRAVGFLVLLVVSNAVLWIVSFTWRRPLEDRFVGDLHYTVGGGWPAGLLLAWIIWDVALIVVHLGLRTISARREAAGAGTTDGSRRKLRPQIWIVLGINVVAAGVVLLAILESPCESGDVCEEGILVGLFLVAILLADSLLGVVALALTVVRDIRGR